ncbi:hypothetical protein HF521_010497 [Silurus meridionalis]|uniref:Uncharacterized protein n=1 Tax=Silurus meridionalis TaxID=175797 RepID=A0A8T0AMC5_SILME|nr:hypothetical protein HF521_010497 [Silurus meridionalis]
MENAEVLELTVKQVENILRDQTHAAELLNHLLECMPLNEDLQDVILDLSSELLSPTGAWPRVCLPGARMPALSPTSTSGGAEEEPNSDLEETFSESAPGSVVEQEEEEQEEERSTAPFCTAMWRPW